MSKGTHWTDTEIANLSKLSRAHTVLELTHLLKRSDASVRRRLEEMGMSAVPAPRARRDASGRDLKTRVQLLAEEGYRPSEIARITGGSIDYVRFVANSYCGGMTKGDQQPRADHHAHILAINNASDGKGYQYGLTRAEQSTSKSISVDIVAIAERARCKTLPEAADY